MMVNMSTALKEVQLNALINQLDAGATPGTITFFTAPMPTTAGGAITTQLTLGTCVLSQPSATVVGGQLEFAPIGEDPLADASGDIAWARFADGDGAFVMDVDCGLTGSGAFIEMNKLDVIANGIIRVTGGIITIG